MNAENDNDCQPELNNKCSKIDINDFNEYCSNYKPCDKLAILHLNIRSINKNFDTLLGYLNLVYLKFSIIVLTETWLCKGNDLDAYNLPGYCRYDEPSVGRRGGIRVFIAESIPTAEQLNIIHGNTFQSLNLTFSIPFYGKVFLGSIYKSPSTSNTNFNDEFELAYSNAFRPDEKIIFIGDFNMDLFKHDDVQINRFSNFLYSLNCLPFITEATRDPPDSENCSLIDNLFSNIVLPTDSFVLDVSITDHFPITILFPLPNEDNDLITVKYRAFNERNIEKFLNDAPTLMNSFVDIHLDDLHKTMENFENWITQVLNLYFPIKQKQLTKKSINAPWITTRVKECIRKKHRVFKLFQRGVIDRNYFNFIRNKVQTILRLSKRNYYISKFDQVKNNIRKTWQVINKSLNRTKQSVINKLIIADDVITDNKSICTELNNHFASVATHFNANSNAFNHDDNNVNTNIIPHYRQSAVFLDSDPVEIYNCIMNLTNNTNLVLPCKFLKLFAPYLSNLLSVIFNECLAQGVYPDTLKLARVTPIFKAGSKSDPGNYRPISVLKDINKVFETLIYRRLNSYLENKQIISNRQYGFRSGVSTQEACIDLISELLGAFTHKKFALCLFIDFRKAFDSINHTILLSKLEKYGIRGNPLKLLQSYLTNRKQYVAINNEQSSLLTLSSGIPQGSTLGPILFNIFINDIAYLPLGSISPFQWADDTAFANTGDNLENLVTSFNEHMNTFYRWCLTNKLYLNLSKTKAMIFSNKQIPDPPPQITINNVIIEYVTEYKYLGLTIDCKLKFAVHINKLNNRLSRVLGAAYSLRDELSVHSAKIFYYAMFYSLLSYLITIWGSSSKSALDNLQITQNKIIRILFADKVPHNNTSDIFAALDILNVNNIYKIELGKLLYNALHNNKYKMLKSQLDRLQWTHNFNTRKVNVYRLPYSRTTIDHSAVLFASVANWNGLPIDVRSSRSLNVFRKRLTAHIKFPNNENLYN